MARNGNIPRDESRIDDPATGEEIGWRETYGIHSLEILFMEEDRLLGAPFYVRKRDRLAVTARDELRAANEQTDQEIAEPLELKTLGGVRDDRSIHDALINWFEGISLRHGKLSRLSLAAKFLVAERLLVLTNRPPSNPAGMLAAWSFAQAWDDWHMEMSGVHATAFYGKSRAEDFTKCTTIKAAKKKTRDAVILQEAGHLFNDKSCRYIAKHYFKKINAALAVQRCKRFPEEEALERWLQRRIKQHA